MTAADAVQLLFVLLVAGLCMGLIGAVVT